MHQNLPEAVNDSNWEIQDGGFITSNTDKSAPEKDINDIPTATPMFYASSFPLELLGILCDQYGKAAVLISQVVVELAKIGNFLAPICI
jgi:hypothetical protein